MSIAPQPINGSFLVTSLLALDPGPKPDGLWASRALSLSPCDHRRIMSQWVSWHYPQVFPKNVEVGCLGVISFLVTLDPSQIALKCELSPRPKPTQAHQRSMPIASAVTSPRNRTCTAKYGHVLWKVQTNIHIWIHAASHERTAKSWSRVIKGTVRRPKTRHKNRKTNFTSEKTFVQPASAMSSY